jgi:hypothetical protein
MLWAADAQAAAAAAARRHHCMLTLAVLAGSFLIANLCAPPRAAAPPRRAAPTTTADRHRGPGRRARYGVDSRLSGSRHAAGAGCLHAAAAGGGGGSIPFFSDFQNIIGSALGAPIVFGWPPLFYLRAMAAHGRAVPARERLLCRLSIGEQRWVGRPAPTPPRRLPLPACQPDDPDSQQAPRTLRPRMTDRCACGRVRGQVWHFRCASSSGSAPPWRL